MITDSNEYLALLYKIQDENPPSVAILAPASEPFIEVDLNTRTIYAPEFISVQSDHRAETVYFKMPRYFSDIDLSQMHGIIQYINAAGEARVFPIPFYDLDTCSADNMMLFPWEIEGEATKVAGTVKFSIRFFKLDTSGTYLIYNISTLEATTKVQYGMDFKCDEIYTEISLNVYTYEKSKYYTLAQNKTYVLCEDDEFDPEKTYYEKSVLDGSTTEYLATFLDQMIEKADTIANHDLTWLVV